jgi:phospholipase C
MELRTIASRALVGLRVGLNSLALVQLSLGASSTNAAPARSPVGNTTTPIKHVIVIIGENRSFDHVFAAYVPRNGETIRNLLSEGIIQGDGTPGPNFAAAEQRAAADTAAE